MHTHVRFFPYLGLIATMLVACGDQSRTQPTKDTRTALHLAPPAQDAVLTEMRTMLGSLNGILTGLASADTAAMRRAASASGLATAADPTLEKILPEQFLQMGTATHQQFDSLAVVVGAGVPGDTIVARLGRLTAACVACHSVYRLSRP